MLSNLLEINGEEHLQQYLEKNPRILIAALGMPEWVYNFVIPKFKFGSDYISDFVIVTGQSYSYQIHLVELEPATEKMFTKNGDYAKRLNHAIKQVDEWGYWIESNNEYFRTSLLKSIKEIDSSFNQTFDYTRRFMIFKKIIMGRRGNLTDRNNQRRYIELDEKNIDIITYDRLVDCENRIREIELERRPFTRFNYDE